MSLEDDFASAQQRVKTLSKTPNNDTLLQLYSFYKQGTAGDVTGSRPGALNFKGRAKYDAWSQRKGMAKSDAQQSYVDLVDRLLSADS